MAVRAHDEPTRLRASGFHHQLMSDSLADVVERDGMARRKLAHLAMKLRSGAARCRRIMVEREDYSRRIEYARSAHGIEIVDGHFGRAVRAQRVIHRADHYIAGASILAGFRGQNLLADRLPGHLSLCP